jgi:hypothetical protein
MRPTKIQRGQLHAHKAATRRLGTELSLDDRDSRVDEAHANATDHTSNKHVWNVIGGRL